MESSSVGLRAMVGRALGLLGVVFAVLGIFVFEGISIEYVGVILGGIGYYLGLRSQDTSPSCRAGYCSTQKPTTDSCISPSALAYRRLPS